VIVRAIGPSLGAAGVAGALANPILTLYDSTGNVLETNDDWRSTQEDEIIATGLAPTKTLESAIVADLPPGGYTAIVAGSSGGSGVALVEVYDLEPENGKLANISTRAYVGAGDDVTIGGFIVQGPQSEKNVIRALGGSLISYGLGGVLSNPSLELYNSQGQLLQTSDNFGSNRDAEVIQGYHLGVTNTLESALYLESAPGSFTAIMRGVNGATGIGLIEVYDVD
jgi:hypothetical protein